jgi:hypothetical protein
MCRTAARALVRQRRIRMKQRDAAVEISATSSPHTPDPGAAAAELVGIANARTASRVEAVTMESCRDIVYDDWHRVERALSEFERRARTLRARGGTESEATSPASTAA